MVFSSFLKKLPPTRVPRSFALSKTLAKKIPKTTYVKTFADLTGNGDETGHYYDIMIYITKYMPNLVLSDTRKLRLTRILKPLYQIKTKLDASDIEEGLKQLYAQEALYKLPESINNRIAAIFNNATVEEKKDIIESKNPSDLLGVEADPEDVRDVFRDLLPLGPVFKIQPDSSQWTDTMPNGGPPEFEDPIYPGQMKAYLEGHDDGRVNPDQRDIAYGRYYDIEAQNYDVPARPYLDSEDYGDDNISEPEQGYEDWESGPSSHTYADSWGLQNSIASLPSPPKPSSVSKPISDEEYVDIEEVIRKIEANPEKYYTDIQKTTKKKAEVEAEIATLKKIIEEYEKNPTDPEDIPTVNMRRIEKYLLDPSQKNFQKLTEADIEFISGEKQASSQSGESGSGMKRTKNKKPKLKKKKVIYY